MIENELRQVIEEGEDILFTMKKGGKRDECFMSVKPKYANEIISGKKKYEFRKSIFKREKVEKMFIYSSSPVKKIISVVDIDCILSDSPQELWEQCHEDAGISEREFFSYFKNSSIGYAIKISDVKEFPTPIDPYHLDED
ncbi:MAG: ASCH domain-containing protein, partial [ANME-2 cluster archaeon]|nr:ASCH domain-containing protein [ANME-2 cluster archaeon]